MTPLQASAALWPLLQPPPSASSARRRPPAAADGSRVSSPDTCRAAPGRCSFPPALLSPSASALGANTQRALLPPAHAGPGGRRTRCCIGSARCCLLPDFKPKIRIELHLLLWREGDAERPHRLRLPAVVHKLELCARETRPDMVRIKERVLHSSNEDRSDTSAAWQHPVRPSVACRPAAAATAAHAVKAQHAVTASTVHLLPAQHRSAQPTTTVLY